MYYFIFSPNNSGTTIMSQFLASQVDGYLPPFGNWEGQMAPTVLPMMRQDPWNSNIAFDWKFIKQEWDVLFRDSGRDIFIEASPPNMLRVKEILAHFGDEMKAVFSMSCPYGQIASNIKHYTRPLVTAGTLKIFTDAWIQKARAQRENVGAYGQFPRLSYEAFCRDPAILVRAFGHECASPVDPKKVRLIGKRDTNLSSIMDLNVKNRSFLSISEILQISDWLEPHTDLLQFFGYTTKDVDELDKDALAHPSLAMAGVIDRVNWTWEARPQ